MALNIVKPVRDVYAELEAARAEIRELKAKLEARPKLISPSEYALKHRCSVATVIRACNGQLGYKFIGFTESRVVGQKKTGAPVVRWYIDPAAHIVHTRSKGG